MQIFIRYFLFLKIFGWLRYKKNSYFYEKGENNFLEYNKLLTIFSSILLTNKNINKSKVQSFFLFQYSFHFVPFFLKFCTQITKKLY